MAEETGAAEKPNDYERYNAAPEVNDAFRRHRAALVTACTPALLIALSVAEPNEMPLMSLAIGEHNLAPFWNVMLVLVGWSFFVFLSDLVPIFLSRKELKASVKQALAYDPAMWINFLEDEDVTEHMADDTDDFLKWGKKRDRFRNAQAKYLFYLHWFTRFVFPTIVGVSALAICIRAIRALNPSCG